MLSFGQELISLYANTPAGSENATWTEKYSEDSAFIFNVTQPRLLAYLPPKHLTTGTAVIIAPGGAFHLLSIENEGIQVAKKLNEIGIAAFVLVYRLSPVFTENPMEEIVQKMKQPNFDKDLEPYIELALADGLQAMEYVRSHAEEYEINPSKIGFMGFSAGGTLTLSVANSSIDKNRPNFIAPIYAYEPAVIGTNIPIARTPIFLTVAGDDPLKMMPMSISIYEKWYQAGQPAELHIYEKGGHGFGMSKQKLPVDGWYQQFTDWLWTHDLRTKLRPSKYEKAFGQYEVLQGQKEAGNRFLSDPGGINRYKNIPPKKKAKAVLLGDSITDAWYSIDSSFFHSNNLVGRGISGQTSLQLLVRFRQDVIDLEPEKVVIHIGTNDVAENTGIYRPELTLGNIRSMIELAQANGITPMIASVLPATRFEWRLGLGNRSAEIVALNARLKELAKEYGLHYIDYHTTMKNASNGLDKDLAEDGVHPTTKGYSIMGKILLKALE